MSMKLGVARWACFGRMQVKMQNAEHLSREQIREFLESSAGIEFAGQRRSGRRPGPGGPSPVSIGERGKPDPQGRPGFLRVDTVHQGDWDGAKGVYHINAVDTVTQWQIVGCTSRISEQFLIPVLEAILHQFPFQIMGFHADNGSEYINHMVAELLNKLVIEFTK